MRKNGTLICYTLIKWYFIALYSMNIEHCPVTTRTVQKISDVLKAGSVLTQLSIALNSSGIKLTKPVVSANLPKPHDWALQLTASLFEVSQDTVQLDLSYFGLLPAYTRIFSTGALICGIFCMVLAKGCKFSAVMTSRKT
ncbi:hypothetical protein SADUNF_Sadunf05G0034700 [Salix dunnii]|uniref:Uncharacterized protein n=1 Tax=Salix dunnii TaxID=1413687 RepID=A0A835K6J9_9ROSI|nr:hypothetical protein SADUNF_Sadunf05G0034700 [Salix dunnii]